MEPWTVSKHETWRTRQYWQAVGGLLIEEFQAIPLDQKKGIGKRLIDAVIVLDEEPSIQKGGRHDFANKDIIVVQTKAGGLGMSLMGHLRQCSKFLFAPPYDSVDLRIKEKLVKKYSIKIYLGRIKN